MTNTQLKKIDTTLPIGSVDAYIQRVHLIPILTPEKELDLATRLYDQKEVDAAKQLVLSNLRFVVKVAKGYMGYGLSLADLIQEGNIGLMKAVKRFNPHKGVRLLSFAIHWIKAEIYEFILRNWRIVKVATTKAQRKLFFNLRQAKKSLSHLTENETQALSTELKIKTDTIHDMEARLQGQDVSFHADADDENNKTLAPEQYLADFSMDPARIMENHSTQTHGHQRFEEAFQTLDSRSQEILQKRWLSDEKMTLQTLAAELNISAERVRQLEEIALQKLKTLLKN